MSADGEQIRPQLLRREGHLEKALDRVGVQEGRAARAADGLRRLPNGQDGAQLVVHQHHGDQYGVGPERGLQPSDIDVSGPVRPQIGHVVPLPLQFPQGLQHGGMLDGGGDDMLSLPPSVLHGPPDRPIVPLGAAGGEHQLLRQAAQGVRHRGPVRAEPLRGLCAESIPRGRIPKCLRHDLQRRLSRLRTHPRGGRIV